MALTATASKTLRCTLSTIYNWDKQPTCSCNFPCKRNIIYYVGNFTSVETTLKPVVERLQMERTQMPRMVIYAHSFEMCVQIHLDFQHELGDEFCESTRCP